MAMNDSIDKIITVYFAAVTKQEFTYKGKVYTPKSLRVSPLIAREHGCPPACAGCCPRFSLDYLPSEPRPEGLQARTVFQDKVVYSDFQQPGWHCKHVVADTGRCAIHTVRPFSCDFEAVRLHLSNIEHRPSRIDVSSFGRAWALKRIDGERGAWCTFSEPSDRGAEDSVRKLRRLKQWIEYFELPHKVDEIIQYTASGQWKSKLPIIL